MKRVTTRLKNQTPAAVPFEGTWRSTSFNKSDEQQSSQSLSGFANQHDHQAFGTPSSYWRSTAMNVAKGSPSVARHHTSSIPAVRGNASTRSSQTMQRLASTNSAAGNSGQAINVLSDNGETTSGMAVNQTQSGSEESAAQDQKTTSPARPTELIQILTSWKPSSSQYGFQLKFRCRSTSGDVRDLQNQPNLGWRERVVEDPSLNDFSHRIQPPNPTILPSSAGGIKFAASNTRIVGKNLLEFTGVTDTHWMPTRAVRKNDFVPHTKRPLPANMRSVQTYQYTTDGGSSWNYLAGAFNIDRTLWQTTSGGLNFTINKRGIHSVTEPYKP